MPPPARARSFSALLRRNRDFRHLWSGQVVSQLGDWFNSVAVYALLLEITGSATAVAGMMAVQLLPIAFVGPFAGAVVDGLDRRRVMVTADLVRGVLMFGLLLVRDAGSLWIAYAVIGASVTATAFFEPARAAILPALASGDELVPANSLSSATWAAMLAAGAGLGGAVTAIAGRNAAFVINAASFFASAWFISRIRASAGRTALGSGATRRTQAGVLDGVRFVASRRDIAALVSVKGAWAIAGGVLLLLTVFGERVFRVGSSAAAGIGILYAARGVGSGAGALLTQRLIGREVDTLKRRLGPAYLVIGLFYVCLAVSPNIVVAALAVAGAHAGGSVLWVASTVLLQLSVPDRFRGRVFALEFALVTLMSSAMSYSTAMVLDRFALGPRSMTAVLGVLFLVPATAWIVAAARAPARAAAPS